jgi:hypothetical protein
LPVPRKHFHLLVVPAVLAWATPLKIPAVQHALIDKLT